MAYLGIDIGGTKTLVAVMSNQETMEQWIKFPTPKDYKDFLEKLNKVVATLTTKKFVATGVAIPGKVDREHGIGVAFANLPWKKVPIKKDVEKHIHAPTVIEHDASLGGISEAKLLKNEYRKVLYLTISTGIGGGFIIDGVIDPDFADTEPGHMILEHNKKRQQWEDFASGRAIVQTFGKQAHEITDPKIWHTIAVNIAIGLLDLLAILQPEVVVIGGGVGAYFDHFGDYLVKELKRYENPLLPIPPIRQAKHPEEAVIYGCYELARATYA